MAVTLVATVGASNANSYLSVAAAGDLANLYLGTLQWAGASADDKARSLIMATRYLDELKWVGSRASSTQALAWPRMDASCDEKTYGDAVIPPELQQATFDLAEALLGDNSLLGGTGAGSAELIPGIPNANLKRASVDVISVEFNSTQQADSKNALAVVPHLSKLLGCLCLSSASSAYGSVRVLRS